ncbi:MAG: hypothetical protein HC805_02525 [Alkalinema sp. RL_2_19]|nr:hypothetical protein [Alkalinema sp. RL_2_19]
MVFKLCMNRALGRATREIAIFSRLRAALASKYILENPKRSKNHRQATPYMEMLNLAGAKSGVLQGIERVVDAAAIPQEFAAVDIDHIENRPDRAIFLPL